MPAATSATVAFFWFLSGILFAWIYQRISFHLAKKVLNRPGQLGRDTRNKFLQGLTQEQLDEFQRRIDAEVARRELM